jgi:uroporphyrinogen-III synthase
LLRQQGARVLEVPVIEIAPPKSWRPLDRALENLETFDWLVLTSANGAEQLFRRMRMRRIAPAKVEHLKIAAIGPATRAALENHGLRVAVEPQEHIAEAVADALASKIRGQRVLVVRAAVARDILPQELRRAGAEVTVAAAYRTRVPAQAAQQLKKFFSGANRPEVVTSTSSSTANNYLKLTRGMAAARQAAFASIGPVTSATLRAHGIAPAIEARSYTAEGLVEAIVHWARQIRL